MEKLGSRDGGENEQKAVTELEQELLLFFEIGIHPECLIPTMTDIFLPIHFFEKRQKTFLIQPICNLCSI